MRCPNCAKFVSQEAGDPEFDLNLDWNTGEVYGTVRIVQNCAECSTELKEFTFDVQATVTIPCLADDHQRDWETEDPEATERSEGSGRYRKTFYGYGASVVVRCKDCQLEEWVTIGEDVPASSMDELA